MLNRRSSFILQLEEHHIVAAKNDPDQAPQPAVLAVASTNGTRPNPTDFAISLAAKGGTDHLLLNPGTERRQPMRGFEEQYVDIIDYIVRITHWIWEEKHGSGTLVVTFRAHAIPGSLADPAPRGQTFDA
jgi:hypothetical protein